MSKNHQEQQSNNSRIATRYNVKKALLDFGLTGYPFEKFIAELFKVQQYEV